MGEASPSERVFISGLPNDIDQGKLKEILAAYGTIKDVKVMSGGSSIVVFATLDEAKWVVDNLDGNMPEGISQPINVKYAHPQRGGGSWNNSPGGSWAPNRATPYGKGGGGGDWGAKGAGKGISIQMFKNGLINMSVLPGGRSSKERADAQQLYIRGLPSDTTDLDLHDIFGPFGAIPAKGVKATLNEDGTCTGIGWVDFVEEERAKVAAQTLNGTMLPDGSTLRIHVKNSTKWNNSKKDS